MDVFDLRKRHCFYFNEISKIPHGSRNEKALSDYICAFAEAHNLAYRQDHVYNVMIDKPASAGYENSETLILQAHIDMVCEKNNDVLHDFETDPLDLYVKDGWLHARGTTLGADDGTGVAYMLAILEDDTIPHPPLECIFTVQEEIGLLGAAELKRSDLHGNRYISLDGGGLIETEVSSAGAATAKIREAIHWQACDLDAYELQVKGLQGGHSGNLIHLERGNANIIAARILKEAMLAGCSLTLSSIMGGSKENAIPREAAVSFVSAAPKETLERVISESIQEIQKELSFSDAGLVITLTPKGKGSRCFAQKESDAILNYIFLMPQGLLHRSMVVENLTTASLNLGVITTDEEKAELVIMARAADTSMLNEIRHKLMVLAELIGMEYDIPEGYPGWAYEPHSKLRDIMKQTLAAHGLPYRERATHGGLECGIVKELNPDMDIITFGPVTEMIHSPDERLELQSFDDGYEILLEMIKACR